MKRHQQPHQRRQLGLGPEDHLMQGDSWLNSAVKIRDHADGQVKTQPCGMIEHYTDAIAEGLVAETQFAQSGDSDRAKAWAAIAARFVSETTRRQREAVKLCRRQKKSR